MSENSSSSKNFGIPISWFVALVIFGVVVLYFFLGTLFNSTDADSQSAEVDRKLFTVLVKEVRGENRAQTIAMSGKTEAARRIFVRAETPGQVASVVAAEGTKVSRGDILCRLETDSREAVRAEASAAQRKAAADLEAVKTLHEEGFSSDTALNQAIAAKNAADAALSRASDDLSNISVRAPFSGVVAETLAEPGDVLSIGAPCAVLADLSQIIVAGGVPARDAAQLSPGDRAMIRLLDGTELFGQVEFVGDVADPATRTFRVEILVIEASGIKEGLEARADITAGTKAATLIPRNSLVYSDDGILGVRVAEPDGQTITGDDAIDRQTAEVNFIPIQIIGESQNGAYVSGLPETAFLIVRGQDYVSDEIRVTIETEDAS